MKFISSSVKMPGRISSSLKSAVKRHFSILVPVYGRLYRVFILQPRLRRLPAASIFDTIYRTRAWEGTESRSGRGSTLAETAVIREVLPALGTQFAIRTMLDIPCGDGSWMSQVGIKLERYIGADIVEDLVSECRARSRQRTELLQFLRLDLIHDPLPRVDLVVCRDCLVHLSFADALQALDNIQTSGSQYLLTTTFPGRKNSDIATGEWHVIDLEAKPFRFPPPLLLFNEQCVDPPGYSDKSMGLWRIADLPNFALSEKRAPAMLGYSSGAILRESAAALPDRKNSIQRGRTASEE
jgi:SAM-dependent methyltransferase